MEITYFVDLLYCRGYSHGSLLFGDAVATLNNWLKYPAYINANIKSCMFYTNSVKYIEQYSHEVHLEMQCNMLLPGLKLLYFKIA